MRTAQSISRGHLCWLSVISLLLSVVVWLAIKPLPSTSRSLLTKNDHLGLGGRQSEAHAAFSKNPIESQSPDDAPVIIPDLSEPELPAPPRDFVRNELLADPAFRAQLLGEIRQRRRGEIAEFHKSWLDLQALPEKKRQILIDQLLDYEMRNAEKMMPISKGGAFPAPPSMVELAGDRREFIARLRHLFGEAVAASYSANFPGPGWTPNSGR